MKIFKAIIYAVILPIWITSLILLIPFGIIFYLTSLILDKEI